MSQGAEDGPEQAVVADDRPPHDDLLALAVGRLRRRAAKLAFRDWLWLRKGVHRLLIFLLVVAGTGPRPAGWECSSGADRWLRILPREAVMMLTKSGKNRDATSPLVLKNGAKRRTRAHKCFQSKLNSTFIACDRSDASLKARAASR